MSRASFSKCTTTITTICKRIHIARRLLQLLQAAAPTAVGIGELVKYRNKLHHIQTQQTHYLLAVQQKLRTPHSDKPTLYNTAADLPSRASNLHLNAAYTDGWLCISTCTYLHIHSDYTAQKVYGRQARVRPRPAQPVHYLSKRNCNLLTTTRLPQCLPTHDIPTDTQDRRTENGTRSPISRTTHARARAS